MNPGKYKGKNKNGGNEMVQNQDEIYSELRKTKEEIINRLQSNNCSPLIKPLIESELKDIEEALYKFEKGTFGKCEISGELIPKDLLMMVPTLKTMDDCKTVSYFLRDRHC
jgi:RNA polymerase-binding transcription factor DksA